jgi:quercetin dioxygenase-like cupin family protein
MRSGQIVLGGRAVFVLVSALFFAGGCERPRQSGGPGVFGAGDVSWHDLGNGSRRKAWFNDHMTVALIEVIDGDKRPAPPAHRHPHEQIGYVLEGRAMLTLGEKTEEIAPGSVYVVTPNVSHTAKPLTPRLVLLESFTPAREDFRAAK